MNINKIKGMDSRLRGNDKLNNSLLAISPLDGKYRKTVEDASTYFSEFALIKYRLRVEITYLIFLSGHKKIVREFTKNEVAVLNELWQKFSLNDAEKVKKIEETTRHDVKALEYFIQKKLQHTSLNGSIPFVHFGLTSYDINIPAYALMLVNFRHDVLLPSVNALLMRLKILIQSCKGMAMLARTHGQPAVPTTMGKELAVFYSRLQSELDIVKNIPLEAKLTGAVGNFNALSFVYPDYDWITFSKQFITSLGLVPNVVTTQILPYDSWLRLFDSVKRLNNILLGFVQDVWWYISLEYFLQKKKQKEVGSSTMSHKINPINFENGEGNLQLANALFESFVRKLAVSRFQRDLSDSTVKRNFGVAFGHMLLALDQIMKGLEKVVPNPEKMREDLENHWEIFAEGVQTYLRTKGNSRAYELLREKTQGKTFAKKEFHALIDSLPIDEKYKKRLKIDSLDQYSGLAEQIVDVVVRRPAPAID